VLSARKLKFWLQASFERSNFEISFENFQKMLDGSKFGKNAF
jgi:hypothetical protein